MNAALVVEGGAMRGIHTCAIFDYFLENDIEFMNITAVSAGALNGMSYVSRQKGRSRAIPLKFMTDKRYYNLFNIFKGKSVFDFDFMFGDLSKKYFPFDYQTFRESNQKYYYTTTDTETGETVYFEKNECDDISKPAAATASLPIFSPEVEINGRYYLDGGISNAVPVEKPLSEGYDKIVVLLTRHRGYRKPALSNAEKKYYRKKFADKPNLLDRLMTVPDRYNSKMELIEKLENEGRIFVIRPSEPIKISRMEKNPRKLIELYDAGAKDIKATSDDLMKYLNSEE